MEKTPDPAKHPVVLEMASKLQMTKEVSSKQLLTYPVSLLRYLDYACGSRSPSKQCCAQKGNLQHETQVLSGYLTIY